ncbi:Neuropilin-1 [Plecturocebus cupreus]
MPMIPALWEAEAGRSPEVGSLRPACPTLQNPVSTENTKISWGWWWAPAVPATREHFGRPRHADHLRPGVQDQPGQHGETPSLLKIQKLAGRVGVHLQSQLLRRPRQENHLSPGSTDCSKLRSCRCTPAWNSSKDCDLLVPVKRKQPAAALAVGGRELLKSVTGTSSQEHTSEEVWWHVPVIPAPQEAEVGGSPSLRRSFEGNNNYDTPELRTFPALSTRFIRIYPERATHSGLGLRMELLGCEMEVVPQAPKLSGPYQHRPRTSMCQGFGKGCQEKEGIGRLRSLQMRSFNSRRNVVIWKGNLLPGCDSVAWILEGNADLGAGPTTPNGNPVDECDDDQANCHSGTGGTTVLTTEKPTVIDSTIQSGTT